MVIPVFDENHWHQPGFRPWVTWILIALNVLIFAYTALLPAIVFQVLGYHFGLVPALVTGAAGTETIQTLIPAPATLLTYMFLHASWLHLAANMLFLWVFGDDVEAATGHLRFLTLYLLCGVAGGLVHLVATPQATVPLIGASAAISGVAAAYLLLRPFAKVVVLVLGIMTVRVNAYWVLGAWLAWQIAHVLVLERGTEIAYWGHLGGFAAGLVLLLGLRRSGVPLLARPSGGMGDPREG